MDRVTSGVTSKSSTMLATVCFGSVALAMIVFPDTTALVSVPTLRASPQLRPSSLFNCTKQLPPRFGQTRSTDARLCYSFVRSAYPKEGLRGRGDERDDEPARTCRRPGAPSSCSGIAGGQRRSERTVGEVERGTVLSAPLMG